MYCRNNFHLNQIKQRFFLVQGNFQLYTNIVCVEKNFNWYRITVLVVYSNSILKWDWKLCKMDFDCELMNKNTVKSTITCHVELHLCTRFFCSSKYFSTVFYLNSSNAFMVCIAWLWLCKTVFYRGKLQWLMYKC